jgi:glycosyltransferase involved in cell wall biosynthesis
MARSTPLISIIVPTRNRPDTLRACLASLRHHRSSAVEFVVQDNCSDERTVEVIEEAQRADPRIRYSRASSPISQRQNFEQGLQAAQGDYLSIIGDDDGYTLGSLDWLAEHLAWHPADAVRWRLVHYAWPSLSTDGEGFVRVYPSHCYGGWANRPAKEIAELTYSARNAGSWENVLVYHGMISRRIYDRARSHTDGVFFHYPLPDVYAHNIIASFCERLLDVDNPVSIYGTSGHSAGSSWSRVTEKSGTQAEAGQKWIAESRSDPIAERMSWQPEIRTLRYHDYQVVKFAKSRGMIGEVLVDRDVWIKAIINEVAKNPWSLGPWLTAQPKADDDEIVFGAIRERFAEIAKRIPCPPGNLYEPTYPNSILRVRYSQRKLRDDVEGAMLALSELLEDGEPLFKLAKNAESAKLKTRLKKTIRMIVNEIVNRTPDGLKHAFYLWMPRPILHLVRRARWSDAARAMLLAERLVKLRLQYEAKSLTV